MLLKQYYQDYGDVIVTAHRGFSGLFPENTLTAFCEAMKLGVHIVEFDVRETLDGELVIMHDATLNRTTDGAGLVAEKNWAELVDLNATCWSGSFHEGRRLKSPTGKEGIPRLEDTLELLAKKVGLNIQVYAHTEAALRKIVALYRAFELEETAFLMLPTFEVARQVRAQSSCVAICVGEARDDISRHRAFGVDFLQPFRDQLTEPYLRELLATGLPFNVFYANETDEMADLLARGVRGIMTDQPDRLIDLARGITAGANSEPSLR